MLILLGVGLFRYWLKSTDLSEELKSRLTNWVTEETDGRYRLSMETLKIDPDKETLTISELVFDPIRADTNNATHYRFHFENLIIKNVSVSSLLESSLLELSTIAISGGKLEIQQGTDTRKNLNTVVPVKKSNRKKRALSGLKVDSIQLSQLDIIYTNRKKGQTKVQSVHLDLYDFHTDSLQTNARNPLPAGGFRLSIENIELDLANKQYKLNADQLILKGADHIQAIISKIRVSPSAGNNLEALAGKTPVQQDIYHCSIPEIVIDSVDVRSFLEDSIIRTPLIVLKEPTLKIFNDRSRPPATQSKIGKNPHQLIQQLPPGLDIPLMQIENGRIEYREKNKDGTDVGKLVFGYINGNAGPIQKGVETIGSLRLDLTARLMDKIPLHARFYFPPGKNGQFSVNGNLQPFDLTAINPIIQPLTNVEIRTGKAKKLEFNLKGTDLKATGRVLFIYEDLKIDLLKEKNSGETAKRPLLTLLANQLLVRNHNRFDDRHPHEFEVINERVPTKSFFNLVWKTLFEGLKMSAGLGDKDKKPA
ncbi:hypothetical protein [Flavihumibacter sp. UBA7668]|uniref:hypothetical protein n=1 Tax=Flavihumibacter sp. UBA7668 TaxID=1946542 RepID=UPI0025BF15B5|nr:hypothetical protein [Flavihumibacter sp. UBA7668]